MSTGESEKEVELVSKIESSIDSISKELFRGGQPSMICGYAFVLILAGNPYSAVFSPPFFRRFFSEFTGDEIPLENLEKLLKECGDKKLFGFLIIDIKHGKISDILVASNIKQKDFLSGSWKSFFPAGFIQQAENNLAESGENKRQKGISIQEISHMIGLSVREFYKIYSANPEKLPPKCVLKEVNVLRFDPADVPLYLEWVKSRNMSADVSDSFWEYFKKYKKSHEQNKKENKMNKWDRQNGIDSKS